MNKACTLQEGDKSVLDYPNKLSSIFSELDNFQPPGHNTVDREYILMHRVYKVLQGLTPEFEANYTADKTPFLLTTRYLNCRVRKVNSKKLREEERAQPVQSLIREEIHQCLDTKLPCQVPTAAIQRKLQVRIKKIWGVITVNERGILRKRAGSSMEGRHGYIWLLNHTYLR